MSQNSFDDEMSDSRNRILRFGTFELDTEAEQLRKNGLAIRLQPQPFKLLRLLAGRAGRIVTREEIKAALWKGETFVDFDQGVNFAVKQVREALGDEAEHSLYIQTIPKRGYRFVAPVEVLIPGRIGDQPGNAGKSGAAAGGTDLGLNKALWANILELRLAEQGRRKRQKLLMLVLVIVAVASAAFYLLARGP